MEQNPVNPGDGAPQVWAGVQEMDPADSKVLERLLSSQLIRAQHVRRVAQAARRGAAGWVALRVVDTSHPAALHDLRHREAIHGNLPQEALDDLLARRGYIGGDDVRTLQDVKAEPAHVCRFERHRGRHHEVEQDTQSPNVCVLPYISLSFEQFRGRIGQGAAECVKHVGGRARRAETKIPHLNAVGAGVEDVLSLQVPVHNVDVMLKEKMKIGATVDLKKDKDSWQFEDLSFHNRLISTKTCPLISQRQTARRVDSSVDSPCA